MKEKRGSIVTVAEMVKYLCTLTESMKNISESGKRRMEEMAKMATAYQRK
jgi:hypothetical protein